MFRSIAVVATVLYLLSANAFAESKTERVVCEFAEPYFSIVYKVSEKKLYSLWYQDGSPSEDLIAENMELEQAENFDPLMPTYVVNVPADADRPAMQLRLTYNFQGTDNISSVVFPIAGIWDVDPSDEAMNRGGCYTNKIPVANFLP